MDGRFEGPGFRMWEGLGPLLGIVLFALFVAALVWAVLRLVSHNHHLHAPMSPVGSPAGPPAELWAADDALNAARMRYARGELDRDQYFRMVEDLTGVARPVDGPPAAPVPGPPVYPTPPPAAPEPGPGSPPEA